MSENLKKLAENAAETNENCSSSATGSPRSKIALKPGHSLMDWIRLGNSGKDLTDVNGIFQDVTPAQLAKHNKKGDAWLAIRGKVYNVTYYMDYHPGGEDELMKGVGKDATDLFNEVHAWVNYESLLQKCVVGRLRTCNKSKVPDFSSLFFSKNKPIKQNSNDDTLIPASAVSVEESSPKDKAYRIPVPLDWYQKSKSVSLVYYTKLRDPQVDVRLQGHKDLSVNLRLGENILFSHVILYDDVNWPCKVMLNCESGKVELEFTKKLPMLWQHIGTYCQDDGTLKKVSEAQTHFESWDIVCVIPVNYNTRLFILRHEANLLRTIPVGYHVHVRASFEGMEVVRSYTPIVPALHESFIPHQWSPECMCLMVKEYTSGLFTPWLCRQQPGDKLDISKPEGSFQTIQLNGVPHIYLLAAGTGLTPMLHLIVWNLDRRNRKCKNVKLLFFNRTEEDILWREQMERLQNEDNRFEVLHFLSEEENWHGQTENVISKSLLEKLVSSTPTDESYFICVCGPPPFMELARKILLEMKCPERQYHCFEG